MLIIIIIIYLRNVTVPASQSIATVIMSPASQLYN